MTLNNLLLHPFINMPSKKLLIIVDDDSPRDPQLVNVQRTRASMLCKWVSLLSLLPAVMVLKIISYYLAATTSSLAPPIHMHIFVNICCQTTHSHACINVILKKELPLSHSFASPIHKVRWQTCLLTLISVLLASYIVILMEGLVDNSVEILLTPDITEWVKYFRNKVCP